MTRFVALSTGLARVGSVTALLVVVANAVCVTVGPAAGTRYLSKTHPVSLEVGVGYLNPAVFPANDLQYGAKLIETEDRRGNGGFAVRLRGKSDLRPFNRLVCRAT